MKVNEKKVIEIYLNKEDFESIHTPGRVAAKALTQVCTDIIPGVEYDGMEDEFKVDFIEIYTHGIKRPEFTSVEAHEFSSADGIVGRMAAIEISNALHKILSDANVDLEATIGITISGDVGNIVQ